ncbi:hypothetical protein P280DRAFT_534489 [Massarina eburnea CBS 473.64]|uniref:Uncharacterized protein n=1 Tax=Massarina eburnea CBS 473.64 TaxID=1395130 RepID=A0A6A6RL20_9PLEO|nr:hypothetical protein P280DRAFT_534489 [Massarina eburnea CBS 473.64]
MSPFNSVRSFWQRLSKDWIPFDVGNDPHLLHIHRDERPCNASEFDPLLCFNSHAPSGLCCEGANRVLFDEASQTKPPAQVHVSNRAVSKRDIENARSAPLSAPAAVITLDTHFRKWQRQKVTYRSLSAAAAEGHISNARQSQSPSPHKWLNTHASTSDVRLSQEEQINAPSPPPNALSQIPTETQNVISPPVPANSQQQLPALRRMPQPNPSRQKPPQSPRTHEALEAITRILHHSLNTQRESAIPYAAYSPPSTMGGHSPSSSTLNIAPGHFRGAISPLDLERGSYNTFSAHDRDSRHPLHVPPRLGFGASLDDRANQSGPSSFSTDSDEDYHDYMSRESRDRSAEIRRRRSWEWEGRRDSRDSWDIDFRDWETCLTVYTFGCLLVVGLAFCVVTVWILLHQ